MKVPLALLFLISPLVFSQSDWIAENEKAWKTAHIEFPQLFLNDEAFQKACQILLAYDSIAKDSNPGLYENPAKPLLYFRMALNPSALTSRPIYSDGSEQQARDEARESASQARADAAYDAATARADALAQHQEQMREIRAQAQEARDQVEQDNQTRWPTGYRATSPPYGIPAK